MADQDPKAKLLLLEAYRRGAVAPDLDGLKRKLSALPGFDDVQLVPSGRSTVVASVPVSGPRERKALKDLVNERVDGWSVIDEGSYAKPTTF